MNKLLSSNFSRLFKWSFFYMVLFIIGAMSALSVIINKAAENSMAGIPFVQLEYLPIIVSALGGMFITRDYSNNTIRNKIIVGHLRRNIYLSNWITVTSASILVNGVYILFAFGLGLAVFDTSDISAKAILLNSLLGMLTVIVSSSVVVLMCMLLKNGISVIVAIMVNFLFMTGTALSQEFPDNAFCKFLNVFLPTSVATRMNIYAVVDNAWQSALYFVLLCAVLTVAGIYLFEKSDLK